MKLKISLALLFVALLGTGYLCVRYYPFVFAKTVNGKIIRVERVTNPETIINAGSESGATKMPNAQLFSFAVAIRDTQGEIHTASSEDRQWAVAQAGQCATAKYFPYPPWELEKGGTYHGARLDRLYDCPQN